MSLSYIDYPLQESGSPEMSIGELPERTVLVDPITTDKFHKAFVLLLVAKDFLPARLQYSVAGRLLDLNIQYSFSEADGLYQIQVYASDPTENKYGRQALTLLQNAISAHLIAVRITDGKVDSTITDTLSLAMLEQGISSLLGVGDLINILLQASQSTQTLP